MHVTLNFVVEKPWREGIESPSDNLPPPAAGDCGHRSPCCVSWLSLAVRPARPLPSVCSTCSTATSIDCHTVHARHIHNTADLFVHDSTWSLLHVPSQMVE